MKRIMLTAIAAFALVTASGANVEIEGPSVVSVWRKSRTHGFWFLAGTYEDTVNCPVVLMSSVWMTRDYPTMCVTVCTSDNPRDVLAAFYVDEATLATADAQGNVRAVFTEADARRFVRDYKASGPRMVGTVVEVR